MSQSTDIIADIPGLGEVRIDGDSILSAYQHITGSGQSGDPMFQQISEWIAPGESESIESKQRDFNNRSYLMWAHSMMSVLEDRYRITKVDSFFWPWWRS